MKLVFSWTLKDALNERLFKNQEQVQVISMGRMQGSNISNMEAMEQTRMLAHTLAQNDDPKFQNSKFLQFVSKMSRSELIIDDNQVKPAGVSTPGDWADEFQHKQSGINDSWADQFVRDEHSSKDSRICIDIYDEVGIGGGASGVSGGLLHPYSPKAKLLWRGAECWKECLKLLSIAETAADSMEDIQDLGSYVDKSIVWRRGILRPATNVKTVDILKENAQNCHQSCRIESIDKDVAQNLVPNLSVPFNSAIYMPQAVNIHPQRYLQALFLACKNLVKDLAVSGFEGNEINFHNKSVNSLLELAEYDAVIICLGAKADMVQELRGKLPLRTCRGVVAQLQLPNDIGDEYGDHSPSILSGAWLAVQGPRNLVLGSTWDWTSRNYSPNVSAEEGSMALEELLPKASAVYPSIKNWAFMSARGGVRAMPPLTPSGSIPLLGCVNDIINMKNNRCKYWLFGGLGARGLLYHGWLGKLLAQAVSSCNEDVLPPELTLWKQMK